MCQIRQFCHIVEGGKNLTFEGRCREIIWFLGLEIQKRVTVSS
jgi:hypothetical protein